VGLLLKLTWGNILSVRGTILYVCTGLYGPGVTDHIRDGGPTATVVEI